MASEKSHIISVQHFPVIKIIRKATIHKIIPSWHQVPPVHMVRPDDMQQVTTLGNHPHTFTAGSTPKLGQSLRQCQHQKHGNCFSLWNTPILEFPNVNFLFDLKQHQPHRKYLNIEVTTLTGLISSYYHGTWVNTSKPSSAVTEGLAPPRQKCTPCITKMKPWNQSTVILSCRVLENLVRKYIP